MSEEIQQLERRLKHLKEEESKSKKAKEEIETETLRAYTAESIIRDLCRNNPENVALAAASCGSSYLNSILHRYTQG